MLTPALNLTSRRTMGLFGLAAGGVAVEVAAALAGLVATGVLAEAAAVDVFGAAATTPNVRIGARRFRTIERVTAATQTRLRTVR